MENLLNNIESSETNNPLLTAALQEIERLQQIIINAQEVLEWTTQGTTFQIDGGEPYHMAFDQLNGAQVDALSNILFH